MIASDDSQEFTFTEKEQIAKTTVLTLIKAEGEDGEHYYAYMAIPANNLKKLADRQRSGKSYRLEDYGKILEAGLGDPSPEVQQMIEEKYGFHHEKAVIISDYSSP